MIKALPQSLIETATKILQLNDCNNINFDISKAFLFDSIIESVMENIDQLDESLNYVIPDLVDVTHIGKQQNPENFTHDKEDGVYNKKVEYSPSTNQVITTFYRDGAWEIHHQIGQHSGEKLNQNKPPMTFVSHMFNWINDKVNNGKKVRISAPEELVHSYHKLATKLSSTNKNMNITDIEPGIDLRRIGIPTYEFYIHHKNLVEHSIIPYEFQIPYKKYKILKENFGDIPFVVEYEQKLKIQGHEL